MGHFLDRNLNFNYVKNYAFNLWKNKGLRQVLSTSIGFIFFMFDNLDSSSAVLEEGPWFFGGHFLVLKKWHNMMKLTKEQLDKIPIWIKLFNVPMEYWDEEGLSHIASAVGELLYMDKLTTQGSRVSSAKICVEIGVDSALPSDFLIRCDDDVVEVRVEYLWTPAKCPNCKVFGHSEEKCVKPQVARALLENQQTKDALRDETWKLNVARGKRKVGENSADLVINSGSDVVPIIVNVDSKPTPQVNPITVPDAEITSINVENIEAAAPQVNPILNVGEQALESEPRVPAIEEEDTYSGPEENADEEAPHQLDFVADIVLQTPKISKKKGKTTPAPKSSGSSSGRRKKPR